VDENHGFTGGIVETLPTILLTNDGGVSWTEVQMDYAPGGDQLNSITFSSPMIGWATTYGFYLYHTTDGGQSWYPVATGFDNDILSMSIPNDNEIFITGSDGQFHLIKSMDGDTSWQELNPNVDAGLSLYGGMVFTDDFTGYIGLGNNYNNCGKLIKTLDGGNSWSELNYGYTYNIQKLSFSDNNHGIIQIQGIGIMVTEDDGLSWPEPVNIAPNLSFFKWEDASHGMACYKDAFIAYTEDGGYTWTPTYQQPTAGGTIQSIYFFDLHNGWACGDNGLIMHYNETYIGIEPTLVSKSQPDFFYPNPAGDFIQLQQGNYQRITIYTIEGIRIESYLPPFGESLNISMLKSGMYIVEATTASGIMRQKLLKN